MTTRDEFQECSKEEKSKLARLATTEEHIRTRHLNFKKQATKQAEDVDEEIPPLTSLETSDVPDVWDQDEDDVPDSWDI